MDLNGNYGQFPLAYAVIEKENDQEWWFFLVGLGIISALKKIMSIARRRVCVIHLYKNFISSYPSNKLCLLTFYNGYKLFTVIIVLLYAMCLILVGTGAWFHAYFYIATNAYSIYVHEKAMEQIKEKDAAVYHWLRDTKPLEHWARFKFDHILKCPDNTNNFVESFNPTILNFRGKPLFIMFENIRKLMGGRFVKRFQKALSWEGKVVPHVEKELKLIQGKSRNCSNIVHARKGEFDVTEVKKGRPKEHKRRDSQPLPLAIGSTSFSSGTTRPRDEYGKLIEKKKKKATSAEVEKRRRKQIRMS
ncbi:hypothetical protein Cgig2_030833 [Carnegiea gigantea]|uniref:Uncharacterized protein n=1 Tax=Carnegiea gigantea TaxID=171969 RepID=A0A9Q1GMS2_9CARY|nr:hypothetical protein Cgig2_030833 [Carnegiea gigantea]